MNTGKIGLINRSYMLDFESISLLKEFAKSKKISTSAALRIIITTFCKGEIPNA